MRFLAITLIVHAPDPVTGEQKPTAERFGEVLASARLAEELGFDGFGVGERHERPFISSSPPVMLSHIKESYELFRTIWREGTVTASPRFRPTLRDAEVWPRPLQQPIRVWHGSATSKASIDLAAQYGDPLFSANVTNPIEAYRPAFGKQLALQRKLGMTPVFPTLEDFVERSSALIGSPQQIIDKVHRYHKELGHTALRREIPDPPWPWTPVIPDGQ